MKVINLLALFLIIALAKTEELEFIEMEPNAGAPVMDKIKGMSNGILCIMNGIQAVLQAFKSSKSSVVKRIRETEGFSNLVGKTSIVISKGVKSTSLDKYFTLFRKLAKIPPKYAAEMDSFTSNIEYVDGDAWASYDFLFDVKNAEPDTTSYASVLGTHNVKTSDNYDFFSVSNTVNFKLAPNIMIMEDSLSVAGGIYAHQKEREVEMPKNITKEDIKLIMQYFQGISFMALGKLFGMQLPSLE